MGAPVVESAKTATSAGDAHREEASALKAKASEWDAAKAKALAHAAQLEDESGQRILDDPSSMASVAEAIAKARTEARLAGAAADKARAAAHAEAVEAWRADAAAMGPAIEAAQKHLDQHRAKVEEALAVLVEVSGADWLVRTPDTDPELRHQLEWGGGSVTTKQPLANQLMDAIAALVERRDQLLYHAERQARSADYVPPQQPDPSDWASGVREARDRAAREEESLAEATNRLEAAEPHQRPATMEAQRQAQARRDRAVADMHTTVARARAFGYVE